MEGLSAAAETRDQFLQLLVTQLRNQDPLEPTKQEDFLAQLAQFSTLEGIEKLNENLEGFLETQVENQANQNSLLVELQQLNNLTNAAGLVGREVEYTSGEPQQVVSGTIESIIIQDDVISVRVDDQVVPFSDIREITS